MIVVDFDRTIFNTDGFYGALRAFVERSDTHFNNWNEMYVSYQSKYNTMDIFKALLAFGVDPKIVDDTRKIAKSIAPDYVYDDSIAFLNTLKEHDTPHTVLTYGDPEFQTFKWTHSGLGDTPFEVTTSPKHVHRVLKQAKVFIDDNPGEITPYLHKMPGNSRVYRMRRPGAKYANHTVASHPSLLTIDSLTDPALLQAVLGGDIYA